MSKRRRKLWSHTEGKRPNRVTVTELEPGGYLYIRVWDSVAKRRIERSLRHRDRKRAEIYCKKQYLKLAEGTQNREEDRVTIGRIFALYRELQTPKKGTTQQKADDRRIEMWLRVLGPNRESASISTGLWERFVRSRREGAIDGRGSSVAEGKHRLVRNRTIEADCKWLSTVMNWAMSYRTGWDSEKEKPTFLLTTDPLKGLEIPHEDAPRRPVATTDRYEAIRHVTDDVMMEIRWQGRRETQRSWLSEVFDIVMETGQRIRRICELRYDDLQLNRGPHGFVRLRSGEGMKTSTTIEVPISPDARAAIDRQRERRSIVGTAYLFPAPGSPDRPMSRHLADAWLRKAERLAGLESQDGTLWHGYRRCWVNARKHEPDVDVAALGGWSSPDTVRNVYQQQDEARMIEIASAKYELREVG